MGNNELDCIGMLIIILQVLARSVINIAKLHLPLTLGKKTFWPKARINMLWFQKNSGFSPSATARSPRNMASPNLFRVGEGARGLVMLCTSCAGGGYIFTEYLDTGCCRGLRWWPVSRAQDGQKLQ